MSDADLMADAVALAEVILSAGHHNRCSTNDGRLCDCYITTQPKYRLALGVEAFARAAAGGAEGDTRDA